MVNCAVLSCKSSTKLVGRDNGDISFHNFPKHPTILKKWIDATGNGDDWFPTKHSKLCSKHFDEDSFTEGANKCRRLIKSAVPTIDVLKVVGSPTLDTNSDSPRKMKKEKVKVEKAIGEPSTSEDKPSQTKRRESSILSEDKLQTKKKETIIKKLIQARMKIKQHEKEIKRLREQLRRRDIKIQNLVKIVVLLKTYIKEEKTEALNIDLD